MDKKVINNKIIFMEKHQTYKFSKGQLILFNGKLMDKILIIKKF